VEFVVQEIPGFLLSELLLLFRGHHEMERVNVITLSQRTQHNMTAWSLEVEEEREQLLEHVSLSVCYLVKGTVRKDTSCSMVIPHGFFQYTSGTVVPVL
jgi:hypothetical protein